MRVGEGTITEIKDGGLAKVRVNRDHLYVACSACFGAEHVYVLARNALGAQEGQDVRYEIQDDHLAVSAFICFILPLILMAAGAVLGYQAGTVQISVVGAVIGLLIGAGIVKKYDTALGKKVDTKATITEIIVDEEDDDDGGLAAS